VVLSLKSANGTSCTLPGTTKWDIGVDLPSTAWSTSLVANNTVLLNTHPVTNAATNVFARVMKAVGTGASSTLLFNNKVAGYGHLLSGSTTGPNLSVTETVTLTAELFRGATGTVTAGEYTASIPLLVWYK
jgi:hypothetical protein